MRSTSCNISLTITEPTEMKPFKFLAENVQGWCDCHTLTTPIYPERRLATFERNWVKANGKNQWWIEKPEAINGVWSHEMSDGNGCFKAPFTITVNLSKQNGDAVNLLGVIFDVTEETNLKKVKLSWYQGTIQSGERIFQLPYGEKSITELRIQQPMAQISKLVITFGEIYEPYNYMKLLKFGTINELSIGSDQLQTATCLMEYDPICNCIPISTLRFTAINKDQQYNLMSPNNLYSILQNGQKVNATVYVTENGKTKQYAYRGFALKKWESTNAPTASFEANNIIGKLEKWTYTTVRYNKTAYVDAELYFDDVFAAAGLEKEDEKGFPKDYIIDDTLKKYPLRGYVPTGSVRDALRHLCLATSSMLIVDANNMIHVYHIGTAPTKKKSIGLKYGDEKASSRELMKGIGIKWYEMVSDTYDPEQKPIEHLVNYRYDIKNTISGNTLITSEEQAAQIGYVLMEYINSIPVTIEYDVIFDPEFYLDDIATIPTAIGTQNENVVTSIELDMTGGLLAKIKGGCGYVD